jgi:hypothetical protein
LPPLAGLGEKEKALSAAEALHRIDDPTEQNSARQMVAIDMAKVGCEAEAVPMLCELTEYNFYHALEGIAPYLTHPPSTHNRPMC